MHGGSRNFKTVGAVEDCFDAPCFYNENKKYDTYCFHGILLTIIKVYAYYTVNISKCKPPKNSNMGRVPGMPALDPPFQKNHMYYRYTSLLQYKMYQ